MNVSWLELQLPGTRRVLDVSWIELEAPAPMPEDDIPDPGLPPDPDALAVLTKPPFFRQGVIVRDGRKRVREGSGAFERWGEPVDDSGE